MVGGNPDPRAGGTLRSLLHREAFTVTPIAHPVRGFCPLAAPVATGRSAGGSAFLLAATTDWGSGLAGATHRPTATDDANLPRRDPISGSAGASEPKAQGPKPELRCHPVHDPTGGIPDVALPLYRTRRHLYRLSDCQPQPQRNREVNWLFR